jgi:hypothetical protein
LRDGLSDGADAALRVPALEPAPHVSHDRPEVEPLALVDEPSGEQRSGCLASQAGAEGGRRNGRVRAERFRDLAHGGMRDGRRVEQGQ